MHTTGEATKHNDAGIELLIRGELDQSVRHFERAISLSPTFIDAYNNLGRAFMAMGRADEALGALRRALDLGWTVETKRLFITCVSVLRFVPDVEDFRNLIFRALGETWSRPGEVATIAIAMIKHDSMVKKSIQRVSSAQSLHTAAQELLGSPEFSSIVSHQLLRRLLESAPIYDVGLERLLTVLRAGMLEFGLGGKPFAAKEENILGFCCALARQCFLNEYVFAYEHAEFEQAKRLSGLLSDLLRSNDPIPPLWLALTASYFPLASITGSTALLDRAWPEPVMELLVQQVREPEEERRLRHSMPAITTIDDEMSLAVRQQYEENPYPRWLRVPPARRTLTIDQYVRESFPQAPFHPLDKATDVDILIAGCGTGQHAIQTAQLFHGARVLAIDLSLASLGYAKRKTSALGLGNLGFAQADILKLGSIERRFDLIEAAGSLQTLTNPWDGWRVLISLLRPSGCMRIGLYSELARQSVVAARNFIAERGYAPHADDIRRCRQEIIGSANGSWQSWVVAVPDFFTISECRDLLFHVQEHRHTLPQIARFLAENQLQFLGFELDFTMHRHYRTRFSNDPSGTDLAQWHVFETENPGVFIGMYQFWVQKKS